MMAYKIVVELDEEEMRSDEAVSVVNYLGEVIDRMGYSYSLDCFKDWMKVMIGLESPRATA